MDSLKSISAEWKVLMMAEAEQGGADSSFSNCLSISLNALYILKEKLPEFSDHYDLCKTVSQDWWFRSGKSIMENDSGNSKIWSAVMEHEFQWGKKDIDKAMDEQTDIDNMSEDEIIAELNASDVNFNDIKKAMKKRTRDETFLAIQKSINENES